MWIAAILIVPDIAPVSARLLAPVPGRQVIYNAKGAIGKERHLLMRNVAKRKIY